MRLKIIVHFNNATEGEFWDYRCTTCMRWSSIVKAVSPTICLLFVVVFMSYPRARIAGCHVEVA